MNKKIILLALASSLSILMLACSGAEQANTGTPTAASNKASENSAPAKNLPADVLRAEAEKIELKSNDSAEAIVKLKILKGYHINGNPASKFQIATSLDVEQTEGITMGQPVYPSSVSKKFSFSDQPIDVYEDEVMIKLPLKAGSAAQKGERTLKGKVRFQACDDEVCYPPRNLETSIPVTIK